MAPLIIFFISPSWLRQFISSINVVLFTDEIYTIVEICVLKLIEETEEIRGEIEIENHRRFVWYALVLHGSGRFGGFSVHPVDWHTTLVCLCFSTYVLHRGS